MPSYPRRIDLQKIGIAHISNKQESFLLQQGCSIPGGFIYFFGGKNHSKVWHSSEGQVYPVNLFGSLLSVICDWPCWLIPRPSSRAKNQLLWEWRLGLVHSRISVISRDRFLYHVSSNSHLKMIPGEKLLWPYVPGTVRGLRELWFF